MPELHLALGAKRTLGVVRAHFRRSYKSGDRAERGNHQWHFAGKARGRNSDRYL
jgi:hypothetical protein